MPEPRLHALVDIGSNGIRCSITDLTPATARILPTVFNDRLAISLYDAQHCKGEKVPLPESVIAKVVSAITRFKKTCAEFGVPDGNINIIATEAMRKATNSKYLQARIEETTGLVVRLLSKLEEGQFGAYGIASSFSLAQGVSMDLGGGSTQLSWIHSDMKESSISPHGAVSLPYGAAALTDLLKVAAGQGPGCEDSLLEQLSDELRESLEEVCPAEKIAAASASVGLDLYVSGGGLRGWGYILMACSEIQPYPITTINGFVVSASEFAPDNVLEKYDRLGERKKGLFRISKRRRSQLPAIAFLITALSRAMPISQVHFSQGGVREGYYYKSLDTLVRMEHPLISASRSFGRALGHELAILSSAIPTGKDLTQVPHLVQLDSLVHAFSFLINAHTELPKDVRASAALRSTTTGSLAGAHGLTHMERAWLAIALCRRHEDEIAPTDELFYQNLTKVLSGYQIWWALFFGTIAAGIAHCYPSGVLRKEGFQLNVSWASDNVLSIEVLLHHDYHSEVEEDLPRWVKELEQIGKKKRWTNGQGVKTIVHEQYRS